jgi:hypothetical protein
MGNVCRSLHHTSIAKIEQIANRELWHRNQDFRSRLVTLCRY